MSRITNSTITQSTIDEALYSFATERQKDYLDALREHGTRKAAALSLGVTRQALSQSLELLEKSAAARGYSPKNDMTHVVPDGFKVKGVSTYYGEDGKPKGQWVKSSIDAERQREIMQASFDALAADLPRVEHKEIAGKHREELMAVYPIGDAHIGMYAWAPETQHEDWDLARAEAVQCGAMKALVELAPAAKKAVVINLGDWFHFDNFEATSTRSGHRFDADSRYAKMIQVGIKVMRQCVDSALEKHESVHVINVIGNHDDTGAVWLSVAMKNIYENNPRVTVDDSPAAFTYFRHGKTLVGCHHGHTCKPNALPGVMAADRARDWGETEHRYWFIGHVHHQSITEFAGCSVESFNTLTARDAWASSGGYRSRQNMKCIVLHEEFGEVCRHTVNPHMI